MRHHRLVATVEVNGAVVAEANTLDPHFTWPQMLLGDRIPQRSLEALVAFARNGKHDIGITQCDLGENADDPIDAFLEVQATQKQKLKPASCAG